MLTRAAECVCAICFWCLEPDSVAPQLLACFWAEISCAPCVLAASRRAYASLFGLLAPAERAVLPLYTRCKTHLYHLFFFKGIRPFYQNGRLPDDTHGSSLALPKDFVADARQCHPLAAIQRCVCVCVAFCTHVSGASLANGFFSWRSRRKLSQEPARRLRATLNPKRVVFGWPWGGLVCN